VELAPGQQIDTHLTLRERLGAGGLGEVWTADHARLGAEVAVKVLLQVAPSSDALERFRREARAVAQLGSPYTVQVFDFGVSPQNRPYIVMERLRGEDLHQRIERLGPMPVGEVSRVVEQVCSALDTAHRAGIVHRDIKPANVFLVDTGAGFHVKVLDFGIAKQLATASHEMTATGAMLGTPYYMSPEQLMDPKRVGPASDLWSVAVMAYAALCGTLPFHGETVGALSVAIHQGHFTPPNVHRPDLPPGFVAWMQRALNVEPTRRHASAVELSRTFQQAANETVAVAAAPTAVDTTGAATAHPARSVSPLEAATTSAPVDRFQATAPPPPPSRPVGLYAALLAVSLVAVVAIGALAMNQGTTDASSRTEDERDAPEKRKQRKTQKPPEPSEEEPSKEEPREEPPTEEESPPTTPAPKNVRLVGRDPLAVIEQLSELAKKKRKDSHLAFIVLSDVPRSGILYEEGTLVVVHYSPGIEACVTALTSGGTALVEEGSCAGRSHQPIRLPRCTPAQLRDKAEGSLPDVPVSMTYILGPGGQPTWQMVTTSPVKVAHIPDDCP